MGRTCQAQSAAGAQRGLLQIDKGAAISRARPRLRAIVTMARDDCLPGGCCRATSTPSPSPATTSSAIRAMANPPTGRPTARSTRAPRETAAGPRGPERPHPPGAGVVGEASGSPGGPPVAAAGQCRSAGTAPPPPAGPPQRGGADHRLQPERGVEQGQRGWGDQQCEDGQGDEQAAHVGRITSRQGGALVCDWRPRAGGQDGQPRRHSGGRTPGTSFSISPVASGNSTATASNERSIRAGLRHRSLRSARD